MEENDTTGITTQANPPLSADALNFLIIAAKWAKFLAIVGFVLTAFMIITGITLAFIMKPLETQIPAFAEVPGFLVSLIYLVVAGISLLPVLFLNSFANNVPRAIKRNDGAYLTKASKSLKNLFAVIGLLTILALVLYFFAFLLIGGAALMAF